MTKYVRHFDSENEIGFVDFNSLLLLCIYVLLLFLLSSLSSSSSAVEIADGPAPVGEHCSDGVGHVHVGLPACQRPHFARTDRRERSESESERD